MSYTEQEKEQTLKFFEDLGLVGEVINKLGYPSGQNIYLDKK